LSSFFFEALGFAAFASAFGFSAFGFASALGFAAAFGAVATCSPDVASCSTTGLTFTLGANSAVKRSGNHTLVMTWKFESIGS